MRGDVSAAASSVVAMMLGAALFVGVVGTMFYQTRDIDDNAESRLDAQFLQHKAHSLSDTLLSSPGYAADGGDWIDSDAAVDSTARLGLRNATGEHLDYAKFDNLRLAPFAANGTDGHLNYPEAVESLGLEDLDLGFHLRAFPTLRSVQEILRTGLRDQHMRVTYIADYERAQGGGAPAPDTGLTVGSLTCVVSPADARSLRFAVTVTNGGITSTQFHVNFGIDFDGGGTEDVVGVTNGFLTVPAPGTPTSDTIHLDVPALAGRSCTSATRVDLEVWDVSTKLRSQENVALASISGTPTATTKDLTLDTSRIYYTTQDLRFDYAGDVAHRDDLTLRIRAGDDATGAVLLTVAHEVPNGAGQRHIDIDAGTLPVGNYTAYLTFDATGVVATERLLIVSAAVDRYTPTGGSSNLQAQTPVAHEVDYLETLVEKFCPYRYDGTTESPLASPPTWAARCDGFKNETDDQPGDVFPDTKRALDDDLPDRLLDANGLPRYDLVDTLVVGSNVDHSAMTSGAAKHAVRDWVLGGGSLIVLGSADQQVQWLQPLFHAGIQSSSGGLSTPDETHPLLHVPDDLDYESYDHRDRTWRFTSGAEQYFTDVREQDSDPILTVSDPGDFGDGNIILTTWTPYDLVGAGAGTSQLESLRLINNLLNIGYRTLYLDYGPPIPEEVVVVPATNKATILHPQLGLVTLDLVVYVFPYYE